MPTIIKLADGLADARINKQWLDRRDMADLFASFNLTQAYRIQHAVTAKRQATGDKLAGYKISMTSPETQAIFEADEPLYGQLTASQVHECGSAEDFVLELGQMNAPLLELELVFIAQADLLASDTPEALCEKCTVAPCLEIPDSRYADWFPNLSLMQVCVDGAVGGKIVLGEAVEADYEEVGEVVGQLSHNGKMLHKASADTVLGHPAIALKWLVDKLDAQSLHIRAGMKVSTGSFGLPVPLETGNYVGEFTNFGQIRMTVR